MRLAAVLIFRLLTGMTPEEYVAKSPRASQRPLFAAWLTGLAAIGALGGFGYAVFFLHTLAPTHAAYLLVLVVAFSISFVKFIHRMEKENGLAIETNWGGLGGGLGGWRVSSTITFLLISSALFALLVVAIGAEPPGPDLFERYRAAINLGKREGIAISSQTIVGRKLYLSGEAPTQTVVNDFWNEVKLANPVYDDIEVKLTVPAPPNAAVPQTQRPAANIQPNAPAQLQPAGARTPGTVPQANNGASPSSGNTGSTVRPSNPPSPSK
jgi:hypothetical protein